MVAEYGVRGTHWRAKAYPTKRPQSSSFRNDIRSLFSDAADTRDFEVSASASVPGSSTSTGDEPAEEAGFGDGTWGAGNDSYLIRSVPHHYLE